MAHTWIVEHLDPTQLQLTDYQPEYALEVVKLWRRSFQRAMGLEEHNRFSELEHQLAYFKRIDPGHIRIVMDPSSSSIVGFMAHDEDRLDHLYVHVDCQRRGIGSLLLDQAKAESPGHLELFTFQQNHSAQAFYGSKGFREIARGVANAADNPWATNEAQLADIRYRWEA